MLYDLWREIAHQYKNEFALLELDSGRRWTFGELAAVTDMASPAQQPVVFPRGNSAEFIFLVLRAWRNGQVVCPLEGNQPEPEIRGLPREWVHVKTTSASTGPARLIAFTGAQLAADAKQIVATMKLRRDWPNLAVISLAHSYGFSNLVAPLLLHGIPLVLSASALPEAIRRANSAMPALTLPAVPALWRAWFDAGVLGGSIRLAISAGAQLPLGLEQELFARSGLKIHNFYGASECGGIAYDRSEQPRHEVTCIGEPMEGVALTLDRDGCLEVRSDAVGQTYWPEPSPNLEGGCFRTSDLAELENGKVFLRGRLSDIINLAGRKVSPDRIEQALLRHPAVRDCLVFGVPNSDANRGDAIVACVALQRAATREVLRDFLLEQLPDWQVPREWWFVETLPANDRGKLSRAEWRERYQQGQSD